VPARRPRQPASSPHPPPPPAPGVLPFFTQRGWSPFPFQQDLWSAYARGASGLLHASTGSGKTLAVWFAAVDEALRLAAAGQPNPPGIKVLWVTPMRALAGDTLKALQESAAALGLNWTIQARTGDTSSAVKARQRDKPPDALITTPESLSVLLSYPAFTDHLAAKPDQPHSGLRLIVADEWHELLGSKRGVQTELCFAHLRSHCPAVRTWGLSATLGNVQHAMDVLLGPPSSTNPAPRLLLRGAADKLYHFDTLLPETMDRFPWAGHLGIRLLQPVLQAIESARSTLLFTNTRSQSEIWYQSILRARPEWLEHLAIHHGSLDRDLRTRVEDRIKSGLTRCVVCTSSLDLGVDYPPVDQVIQIGSPKGVGRLLQRAGRSGHQPGQTSRVLCVPTNALEIIEFAAARDAMLTRHVEARSGLTLSLDVLVQHLVTLASGPGFVPAHMLAEVRTTHAFADLTDQQWAWALDFAARGGAALKAYDRFARLIPDGDRLRIASNPLARLHRQGIGTIMSDTAIAIRTTGGAHLGSIEEGFIARLKLGDVFVFAGRRLRLIRVSGMTAYVRQETKRVSGSVPSWQGARMPLSHELAEAVKARLARAAAGEFHGPEIQRVRPILDLQSRHSALPVPGTLLIERCATRDGHHAFIYPLAGRLVHEGLAALVAYRIARTGPRSFEFSANDYGFELLSSAPLDLTEADWRAVLSPDDLAPDLLACMNAAQLARRQFREIARIAGLIIPGFPGAPKSNRQLQASSELIFDVFTEFDPDNLLLSQAQREVLDRQLEFSRLAATLQRLAADTLRIVPLARLSPFAFPLWADRLREQLSTEQWENRLRRMIQQLEAAESAGATAAGLPDEQPDPQPPNEPIDSPTGADTPEIRTPQRRRAPRWRRPRL